MLQQNLILNVQKLTKRFPGVVALNNLQLQLHEGEFLSLIGENGAGKSTLMKILAGVQLQDEGTIEVFGKTVRMDSVKTAQHHGIALIHQELNLSENLSIAANIFLGREPAKAGFIDKATIRYEAQRFLDMVGLKINPETLAGSLSIGQQQLVEIAKALSIDARILIMDEPTSSLSAGESERLFEVIAELRERGVSIIYISHRLGEVKMLSDRVTVFPMENMQVTCAEMKLRMMPWSSRWSGVIFHNTIRTNQIRSAMSFLKSPISELRRTRHTNCLLRFMKVRLLVFPDS